MRARHYDASVGRFLQTDPDPGEASRPITLNSKYIYVGNNPLSYIDPKGEFFFLTQLFVGESIASGDSLDETLRVFKSSLQIEAALFVQASINPATAFATVVGGFGDALGREGNFFNNFHSSLRDSTQHNQGFNLIAKPFIELFLPILGNKGSIGLGISSLSSPARSFFFASCSRDGGRYKSTSVCREKRRIAGDVENFVKDYTFEISAAVFIPFLP